MNNKGIHRAAHGSHLYMSCSSLATLLLVHPSPKFCHSNLSLPFRREETFPCTLRIIFKMTWHAGMDSAAIEGRIVINSNQDPIHWWALLGSANRPTFKSNIFWVFYQLFLTLQIQRRGGGVDKGSNEYRNNFFLYKKKKLKKVLK